MNEFDYQNAVYLVILIVVMVLSVASRQDLNWKKIIRYFLIWGLTGFVCVVIYAFRFEFNDFKSRIFGELNPTSAKLNNQQQIVINIAKDGHFYVKVLVNSKAVLFMIDTGASDIMLNLNDAKKIGINLRDLVFNKPYQTANGRSWGASVVLQEVSLAGVKFNQVMASVNDSDMGVALLGMSFLRRFSKYEFFQDRLILTP